MGGRLEWSKHCCRGDGMVHFEVLALIAVLVTDLALCFAFDSIAGNQTWKKQVWIVSLVRCGVNILTLGLSLRWGIANKHIQAEGLMAAYAVISTPEFKRPLLRGRNGSTWEENPEVRAYRERRKAERWRTFFLVVAFLFNTCVTFYLAIKCVYIDFVSEHVQAPLLFSIIVISSCEFYILKLACDAVTRVKGHLVEAIHPHKLYFWPKLAFHSCDICLARIIGRGYRCKRCDFDVCHRCFASALKLEEEVENSTEREGSSHSLSAGENEPEIQLLVRDDADHSLTEEERIIREESKRKRWQLLHSKLRAERQLEQGILWELLRPHWKLLFVSSVCLIGFAVSRIGLPNFQGNILDAVFEKDTEKFHRECVYLGLFSFILVVFGMIRDAAISIVGRRIATEVRNRLFSAVLRQDLEFFDRTMSGYLTASITNDVNAMVAPWKSMLTNAISNAFVIFGGLCMCLYTSWRLTAIALTSLLPISYVASVYTKWSTQINREIWSGISDANSVATEALANIRTVKAFAMEEKEVERFIGATNNALGKGIVDAVGTAITNGITQHLSVLGTVLVLAFGGWEAINHPETLSPGELVTFQLYWTMVNTAYKAITDSMNDFSRANAAAQRVMEMLAKLKRNTKDTEAREKKEYAALSTDEPVAIQFHNVSFSYPSNPRAMALRDIDLLMEPNAVTVLAGRSGAGKSTIFNLLCRFYEPTTGYITVNDQPFNFFERNKWRKHIGLVSQDVPLFGVSIFDNLVYGLPPDSFTLEDVINAAKDAHAHSFIMSMKFGYQTRLGERGVQCSLGEKARLAIARALLRKPRVLLLDEPTANLDPESQRLVQDGIHALLRTRNSTVVLITHKDSSFVQQYASKIYVFEAGMVVEQGSYEKLASDKSSLYYHLFRKD